jgi:phosphoribosylamine--glycine ligase
VKVLVVGSGGREHALVWKLTRESSVSEVVCAPGNPGIAGVARCVPIPATDVEGLLALARTEAIDLTVVGPEAPLAAGLADRFASEGLTVFGPTAAAARLETSKAFAKEVMMRAGVPTARYRVATSPEAASAAIHELGGSVALKADGLAAGKGVIVASTTEEARAAVKALMVERRVGDAGRTLVVEERLDGREVSFFAIADGERAVPLMTAQDHKRAFDDDLGPNTGGMGAFAPSPFVDSGLEARIMREIVNPVIDAMRQKGHPFRGFLYAGLMLTSDGPKVIEFNVRLGDPEAQVVLPRTSSELAPLLVDAARGALDARARVTVVGEPYVGVVIASRGYPEQPESGRLISGLDAAASLDGVDVFHAGTKQEGDRIVTAGGRVLTVVAHAPDFKTAIDRAYAGVSCINFEGMHARRDIGRTAIS